MSKTSHAIHCQFWKNAYVLFMTLEIRQLRAFLAIAECGSIGRAADAVNLSQPALSRTLAEMERRAGHRLFERHTRGMALTAAGETLLPYARLVVFEAQQAQLALDDLDGLKRGTVRIGAVAAIVRGILPQVITQLLANAPSLRVKVLEQTDEQLIDLLRRRELDLAISASRLNDADVETIAECLHADQFTAFCAPRHPLAQGDRAPSLSTLLEQNWVMPPETMAPRRMFLQAVTAAGANRAPRVAVETTSHDAMVRFVAAGDLLGWLPRALIATARDAGEIVELHCDALATRRRFFVLRRTRGSLTAATGALLNLLPLRSLAAPNEDNNEQN